MFGFVAGHQDDDDEPEEDMPAADLDIDSKVGAKKRAKLEAKAEKKAQREVGKVIFNHSCYLFLSCDGVLE